MCEIKTIKQFSWEWSHIFWGMGQDWIVLLLSSSTDEAPGSLSPLEQNQEPRASSSLLAPVTLEGPRCPWGCGSLLWEMPISCRWAVGSLKPCKSASIWCHWFWGATFLTSRCVSYWATLGPALQMDFKEGTKWGLFGPTGNIQHLMIWKSGVSLPQFLNI